MYKPFFIYYNFIIVYDKKLEIKTIKKKEIF